MGSNKNAHDQGFKAIRLHSAFQGKFSLLSATKIGSSFIPRRQILPVNEIKEAVKKR